RAPAAASEGRRELRECRREASGSSSPSAQRARGGEAGPRASEVMSGGGAGSCTRVRKYIPAGIYDAYPRLKCRARRGEAAKPPGANPEKSHRDRPRQPIAASLLK